MCTLSVETLFTLKKKCLIKPKHDLHVDCSASLNEIYKIYVDRINCKKATKRLTDILK